MENASKALLMAGGILLTILVISLLLYAWTAASEYQASQDRIKEVQALAEFNQEFTNYQRDDVQGYELISLVNKVIDYNQRFSEVATTTSLAGNSAQYKPVKIKIQIDDSSHDYEKRDSFTTSIIVPAVAKNKNNKYTEIQYDSYLSNPRETRYQVDGISDGTYIGNEEGYVRLFKLHEYEQSDTSNKFKDILDRIHDIEEIFGGDRAAQSLSKSTGTIFAGKIINYNGQPDSDSERKIWYEEGYIKSRYKTLTGKNVTDIDDIRSDTNITAILQYYEYMEFKKAEFKCTRIDYDDGEAGESNTGRVIEMDFVIKE